MADTLSYFCQNTDFLRKKNLRIVVDFGTFLCNLVKKTEIFTQKPSGIERKHPSKATKPNDLAKQHFM